MHNYRYRVVLISLYHYNIITHTHVTAMAIINIYMHVQRIYMSMHRDYPQIWLWSSWLPVSPAAKIVNRQ